MRAVGHQPKSWRGLVGLLVASAISLSGTRLSMIALPWFAITTTGSPALTGVAVACQMGPYVVAKALGGPFIDRLGSRRIIVSTEIAAAAVVAIVPVLHMLGVLHFGVFLVAVALLGAASGPADGAKAALMPVVATQARVPLERVTGLYGSIERFASTVGAGAAGAVVALLGAVPSLWVTAVTFAGAALIIAVAAPRPAPLAREPYLPQLREGLTFIGRDRLLRSVYAMTATTNLLDAAAFSVLLPTWAHETGYGPAAIGLVGASMSAAAVCSSVLAAAIGHRMPRRLTYLVGFMIAGIPRFLILAVDVPLGVVVAVFVVSGFGAGFLNPIIGAVILERIPPELIGRVTSMGSSLAWAGIPFGGLLGGGLATAAGLAPALVICGVAYFIVTTLPGLQKEWKQMDARRATSAESRETVAAEPASRV